MNWKGKWQERKSTLSYLYPQHKNTFSKKKVCVSIEVRQQTAFVKIWLCDLNYDHFPTKLFAHHLSGSEVIQSNSGMDFHPTHSILIQVLLLVFIFQEKIYWKKISESRHPHIDDDSPDLHLNLHDLINCYTHHSLRINNLWILFKQKWNESGPNTWWSKSSFHSFHSLF